jgi:hypothetical protein
VHVDNEREYEDRGEHLFDFGVKMVTKDALNDKHCGMRFLGLCTRRGIDVHEEKVCEDECGAIAGRGFEYGDPPILSW